MHVAIGYPTKGSQMVGMTYSERDMEGYPLRRRPTFTYLKTAPVGSKGSNGERLFPDGIQM